MKQKPITDSKLQLINTRINGKRTYSYALPLRSTVAGWIEGFPTDLAPGP